MVARFFKSRQLVTWAESLFLLKEGSHGAPAMEVASYLNSWLALQPPSTRDIVQMNVFVEAAYDELDVEYRRLREFRAPFLRSRFAQYYAWKGDLSQKGLNLLVLASQGLEDQLGWTDRMALMARYDLATGKAND